MQCLVKVTGLPINPKSVGHEYAESSVEDLGTCSPWCPLERRADSGNKGVCCEPGTVKVVSSNQSSNLEKSNFNFMEHQDDT